MADLSTFDMDSSAYAQHRGPSSIGSSSSNSGVRSNISSIYPNKAPMISPPFSANRYGGPAPAYGMMGQRHDASDGYANQNGSGSSHATASQETGAHAPSAAGPSTYAQPRSTLPQLPAHGRSGSAIGSIGGGVNSGGVISNGVTNSRSGNNFASGAGGTSVRARPRRPDTEEIKRVARVHYEELLKFLRSHLAKGQRGPRTNAREKLTRLSQQQFTELSTDVYDELMRRITNARTGSDIPHLAVREEFHPKRNQARQKLATLPRTRFKDLSSDVFFELERRFPELRDEFRPDVSERERREEQEAAHQQRERQNSILSNREDDDVGSTTVVPLNHDHSIDGSDIAPQPSTSDVVIPTKSTLIEEQIAVPYAEVEPIKSDDAEKDGATLFDEKDARTSSEGRAASIRDSIVTTNELDNNRSTMYSQASSIGTGFFNGYAASRATESVASPNLARASQAEGFPSYEVEKLKSDYEFRIATLQQKVLHLESQNTESEAESRQRCEALQKELDSLRGTHRDQISALEDSVASHRGLHEAKEMQLTETAARLNSLQEEHRVLQDAQKRSTDEHTDAEELEQLRQAYAEQERLVTELRGEVGELMEELRQLSLRNDEILGDKESDQAVVRDLNNQVASYRRKYENAKTELRNLKATSQLFVQPPKTDDFMPPSDKGAIADVNLTAFQSSIDDLLAAARSKTPSNVLLAMKTVVLAATLITDDVTKFELRDDNQTSSSGELKESLLQVKPRISGTLNNLMTACRNHASSHGLSPVSLLDAAASHVSTSIVDLVKLVKVRKATKEEAEEFEATFTQNGTLPNGLKPLLGSSNLANAVRSDGGNVAAFASPATGAGGSDGQRRRGGDEADGRLLGTPGSVVEGNTGSVASRSFSPRLRQGGPSVIGRYSPVSYRADITRKTSAGGEGSWKTTSDRSRNASISSNSSQLLHSSTDRVAPAVPAINAAVLRAASNRSVTTNSTPPRSPGGLSNGATAYSSALPRGSSASSGLQAGTDDEVTAGGGNKSFSSSSDNGGVNVPFNDSSIDNSDNDMRTAAALPPLPSNALAATPPPPLPPLAGADESSEAYWAELRNYIEVQTEAIVHCIQALLSSIREGAQGNQLHENLTQITTIVSSIIAISMDNIPRAAAIAAASSGQDGGGGGSSSRAATASIDGERILRELSEHCEKLIEMQSIGGQFDKTTKSNMASASYGVAKGLKALNGLLNLDEQH